MRRNLFDSRRTKPSSPGEITNWRDAVTFAIIDGWTGSARIRGRCPHWHFGLVWNRVNQDVRTAPFIPYVLNLGAGTQHEPSPVQDNACNRTATWLLVARGRPRPRGWAKLRARPGRDGRRQCLEWCTRARPGRPGRELAAQDGWPTCRAHRQRSGARRFGIWTRRAGRSSISSGCWQGRRGGWCRATSFSSAACRCGSSRRPRRRPRRSRGPRNRPLRPRRHRRRNRCAGGGARDNRLRRAAPATKPVATAGDARTQDRCSEAPASKPVAPRSLSQREPRASTPFSLAGGAQCRTWDDFLVVAAQNWAALRDELTSGRLAEFLRRIQRPELVPLAGSSRSPDDQLDDWLARIPATASSSPELDVHPETLLARAGRFGGRDHAADAADHECRLSALAMLGAGRSARDAAGCGFVLNTMAGRFRRSTRRTCPSSSSCPRRSTGP